MRFDVGTGPKRSVQLVLEIVGDYSETRSVVSIQWTFMIFRGGIQKQCGNTPKKQVEQTETKKYNLA